jgi:outer membrane receptor protein involved in Fe transport
LTVALSLVLAGAALAQAPAPEEAPPAPQGRADGARKLEQVQVTATRRAESTLDVPQATTVVTQQQLRALAPQTVMDALHGEPGTFVQQTTPGQGVVIVRGLKGSEVLHLVDGFRLNNAIFRNAPSQYIALVDSQMLEGIEVVRGPMSTLYGGDAMGGVIQMRSWEPRFDDPHGGHEVRLRTLHASADESWLSRAEGAAGNERFVVSGGATSQDVGRLRVGGGDELPFTDFGARAADLKLRAVVADGHELILSAQYLKQPQTARFDELVPGFGQTEPTSAVFLFEPQARELHHLRYRGDFTTPAFDHLEAHLGRQRIRDDRRTRDFGSRNEDRERNQVETDGVSIQLDRSVGDHYLTYGAEYYQDQVASTRQRRNVDSGALSTRAPRFPNGSTQDQLGLYASDDWPLSSRWDLNYGLRWSRIRVDLPPTGSTPGVTVDEDDVSGNAGVAFAISDALKWVANVGRGFRAPNVFDLGTFGSRPGNRFNIPNPDLKPETVVTVDTGLKFSGARADGELIAFRSDYDDKISSVLTGAVTESGQLVVQSRNATALALWGIEGGLNLRPRDDLRLYATATYTRGDERFDGDEYPADRIPPLFGKLGALWDVRDDVTLEGYAFYAAAQDRLSPRDAIDPRIDPDGTAGWATWNARVAWRPHDDLTLSLRLENLGDKRYREHGTGLDEPGFNAIATVDWRF